MTQYLWPKLFVADEHGIRLFLQRDITNWTANPNSTRTSNPYNLVGPQVSDDGSVLAFTSYSVCTGGGSGCVGRSSAYAEVQAGSLSSSNFGVGTASLSRNGRFLLRFPSSLQSPPLFHDRISGDTQVLPYRTLWGRHAVTNEGGILLLSESGQLVLWHPLMSEAKTTIADIDFTQTLDAQVDADGSTVVFLQYTSLPSGSDWNLYAVDVGSGKRTRVAFGRIPPPDYMSYAQVVYPRVRFSLSSNGKLALFTQLVDQAMQLFLAHTDGSGVQALTTVPGGIAEAVLSGNGHIAYATTNDNSLLKIDVDTGEARTLVDPTALVSRPVPTLTPGSYAVTMGRGFLPAGREETALAPLPRSLAGVQLIVGGVAAPIISMTPTEIAWQVPWAANIDRFEIKQGGATFEQGPIENLCCNTPAPRFLTPFAIHEAFDATVTHERPARPGEIVHFYMTGLGEVSLAVPSGEASPANPPATVLEGVNFFVGNMPAEVLFAGLAPGLVGIYQVDVRLPAGLPAGDADVIVHLTTRYPQALAVLPIRP